MWTLSFALGVLLVLAVDAYPRREAVEQTPAEDRSWFKKKGPEYEINPNFGFRSYHQVRYEPMTVPFENEYAQPPIPPMDFNLPMSAPGHDDPYMDSGYSASNNDFKAVPFNADVSIPYSPSSDFSPTEFSSRQSSFQRFY